MRVSSYKSASRKRKNGLILKFFFIYILLWCYIIPYDTSCWIHVSCFEPFLECMSQVAQFFDATITKGADAKLAANWIMGDIAAYMKNEKLSINEIKLTSEELAELIASIKSATISGKIGKEVKVCIHC